MARISLVAIVGLAAAGFWLLAPEPTEPTEPTEASWQVDSLERRVEAEVADATRPEPRQRIETDGYTEAVVRLAPKVTTPVATEDAAQRPRRPAPPATLSGIVMDDDGNPLRNIRLGVTGHHKRVGDVLRWSNEIASVTSRHDGTFSFHGNLPDEDLVVFATGKGWFQPRLVRVVPHQHDVEVRLRRGGLLPTRVETGLALSGSNGSSTVRQLTVRVRGLTGFVRYGMPVDPGTEPPVFEAPISVPAGDVHLEGLPPGTATLEVMVGRSVLLTSVTSIPVDSGRVVADPRVVPKLDLSGDLDWTVVSVRDAAGSPVSGATVELVPNVANGERLYVSTGEDGRARIPQGRAAMDLSISRNGTGAAFVPGVSGDVDVTLAGGGPLSVRLIGASAPSNPWLHVSLQWMGRTDEPDRKVGLWVGGVAFGKNGVAEFAAAPGPGRYRATVALEPVLHKFG